MDLNQRKQQPWISTEGLWECFTARLKECLRCRVFLQEDFLRKDWLKYKSNQATYKSDVFFSWSHRTFLRWPHLSKEKMCTFTIPYHPNSLSKFCVGNRKPFFFSEALFWSVDGWLRLMVQAIIEIFGRDYHQEAFLQHLPPGLEGTSYHQRSNLNSDWYDILKLARFERNLKNWPAGCWGHIGNHQNLNGLLNLQDTPVNSWHIEIQWIRSFWSL